MDEPLRLIIYKSGQIFDNVIISYDRAITCQDVKTGLKLHSKFDNDSNTNKVQVPVYLSKKGFNAYLISAYVVTLKNSNEYRKAAVKSLLQFLSQNCTNVGAPIIVIKLQKPRKEFLDYRWNDRVTYMVLEQREVDCAMSWLSTLGGAFSALGEEFQDCAEMAGKISLKQFELALRLGNPPLVARCKLYTALSLIQQNQFKRPREMIIDIYKFAITERDTRLQNMCRGVWAKLKYCLQLKRQQKHASQTSKRVACNYIPTD